MTQVKAYAMDSATSDFHPVTLERREPGPTEIYFEIKYAGVCHSDIHTGRAEWGEVIYPLTPGHEIAGIVTKIGSKVTKFAVGDREGSAASWIPAANARPARQEPNNSVMARAGLSGLITASGATASPQPAVIPPGSPWNKTMCAGFRTRFLWKKPPRLCVLG